MFIYTKDKDGIERLKELGFTLLKFDGDVAIFKCDDDKINKYMFQVSDNMIDCDFVASNMLSF